MLYPKCSKCECPWHGLTCNAKRTYTILGGIATEKCKCPTSFEEKIND